LYECLIYGQNMELLNYPAEKNRNIIFSNNQKKERSNNIVPLLGIIRSISTFSRLNLRKVDTGWHQRSPAHPLQN
jgi:hypothetical protein